MDNLDFFVEQKLSKQLRCHTIGNQVVKKVNFHNHEVNAIENIRNGS